MTHILHLNASPRSAASFSRAITDEFLRAWKQVHPGDTETFRDLGHQTIPYMTEELIDAFYTPDEKRTVEHRALLSFSDELVAELVAADIYVFAMPMYNFNVPAVFKAYIDLVVRLGVTVTSNWEGLLKNKRAFLITARGGGEYGKGEAREAYNFEDPYLRTILNLLGVTDQTYIHVASTSYPEDAQASLIAARARIREIVGR